jgi:hypothetical protein
MVRIEKALDLAIATLGEVARNGTPMEPEK